MIHQPVMFTPAKRGDLFWVHRVRADGSYWHPGRVKSIDHEGRVQSFEWWHRSTKWGRKKELIEKVVRVPESPAYVYDGKKIDVYLLLAAWGRMKYSDLTALDQVKAFSQKFLK